MIGDHGIRLLSGEGEQLLAVNIGGDVLLAEFVPHHPTDGHGTGVGAGEHACEQKLNIN